MSSARHQRFIGEFLTMLGVFRVNTWVAFFAATGVILSAAYALWLYRRVIFGALTKDSLKGLLDLSTREKVIIYPLSCWSSSSASIPHRSSTRRPNRSSRSSPMSLHPSARADRGGELTRGLRTMTPDLLSSLSLSTPELILAIGALALLMVVPIRAPTPPTP